MEPVKCTHTLGHTNNTPLTDCFVSQNKHIERIVSEIIARMDRTHTDREREGWERPIICSGLSQIGPFTYCRHCVAFPLAEGAVGLILVLMATICLAWPYCVAGVTIERDSGL